jgi:hypothetical protein
LSTDHTKVCLRQIPHCGVLSSVAMACRREPMDPGAALAGFGRWRLCEVVLAQAFGFAS